MSYQLWRKIKKSDSLTPVEWKMRQRSRIFRVKVCRHNGICNANVVVSKEEALRWFYDNWSLESGDEFEG